MAARQLLLISSSRVHGYEYLQCNENDINTLLKKNNVCSVLFIPYALKDYDSYLKTVSDHFLRMGHKMHGIHKQANPIEAIEKAEAIYVGGGNTFRLLKTLYDCQLVEVIRKRVLEHGIPYIGSSAGSNVATKSIHTTNDMPIVYPPTFDALKLIPFNINPHYLDADENSTHRGETREQRIVQYLEEQHSGPVLGLREGNSLLVKGNTAVLKGITKARLFLPGKEATEIEPETDLSCLLLGN